MTITLQISEDTSPRMLRAVTTMLHQLQQTALERGPEPSTTGVPFVEPRPGSYAAAVEWPEHVVESLDEPVPSAPRMPPLAEPVRQQLHGLDSQGLPWDERIHSDKRGVNADGTWRLRRNINTTAPGLVERVRAEQRAALAAPAAPSAPEPPTPLQAEYVALPLDGSATPPSPVTDAPVAPLPPTPPVPIAVAPAPPQTVAPAPIPTTAPTVSPSDALPNDEVTDPATHFRHVMLRITADQAQGIVTTAGIDAALTAVGLATIRDLTTRLDLVIPFERALYVGQ